ncbi:MAG: hypothetical protein AB7S38_40540 [Vulcanimicrobiota bacterium]
MKNPTAALQQAFGEASEPTTIRELFEALGAWSDGQLQTEAVIGGIEAMLAKLEQAAQATRDDLLRQSHLEAGLKIPIEHSLTAYEDLHAVLVELEQGIKEGHTDQVESAFEGLSAAAEDLAEAQQQMEEWLADPSARCLRCGESLADPCPNCGLELLRPDRHSAFGDAFETSILPAEFSEVAARLQQVLSGQRTLSTLWPSLTHLQSLLCNYQAAAQAASREHDSPTLIDFVLAIDEALAGIELMNRCVQTRATADLRAGWRTTFEAGKRVTDGRRELLGEFASPDEALDSVPSPTFDSVFLSDSSKGF